MQKIDRKKYAQLDALLWDTSVRFLAEREALETYERRWPFVDEKQLTPNERHLIELLARKAGGFLPARG